MKQNIPQTITGQIKEAAAEGLTEQGEELERGIRGTGRLSLLASEDALNVLEPRGAEGGGGGDGP